MINESRLINGTLTLTATGGVGTPLDMSCQVTNARITSAYSDDGDHVTTLCGDTKPPPRKLDGHKLEGTIVQDFDIDEATGGVIAFLWAHDLEVVAYEYTPNDTSPVISGNLQVEIPGDTYGGDVNKRITSDFAWNLQEKPTFTPAAGGAASASSSKAKANGEKAAA
jgi:hypothetical protein